MKKLIILFLLLSCTLTFSAFAEGKLKATHKNLFIVDDDEAYFFARVENIGDAPIGMESSKLVAFNEDDEILLTENYVAPIPNYLILEPGEYVYVQEWIWDSTLKGSAISDYKFSASEYGRATRYNLLPCTSTMLLNGKDSYSNYINVTFTNTSDETIWKTNVSAALYDTDNNLLFADGKTIDTIGIHPNCTVTVEISVPNAIIAYYYSHNLTPSSIDAIVRYSLE